jgi:hypothetical protein
VPEVSPMVPRATFFLSHKACLVILVVLQHC